MSIIKPLIRDKIGALGLHNTEGFDSSQQKSLSIKYTSCSKDDKFIYLRLEVFARNLNDDLAVVYVDELDNYINDTTIPKTNIKIAKNTDVGITLKFDKNKNFTEEFYDDGNIFQATITCNNISAKSQKFNLNFPQVGSNKKTCFCNRDMTSGELKNIVIGLRKEEVFMKNSKLIRDTKGNAILKNGKKQYIDITMYDQLHEDLFNLDYPEKINPQNANFNSFSNALNKTFKDYDINTCIRKIHFLAQCYHETQRFTITYERNPNSNVHGGAFYRGRGLIQLTHDYNYEKLKKALKIESSLDEFVPKVAKEINFACQASGYFWKNIGAKTGNINQYADKDDVLAVSKEINGYVEVPNGFNDRKLFTNILKKIMNYDQCKNKK